MQNSCLPFVTKRAHGSKHATEYNNLQKPGICEMMHQGVRAELCRTITRQWRRGELKAVH